MSDVDSVAAGAVDDLSEFSEGGVHREEKYVFPEELAGQIAPKKAKKKGFRFAARSVFLTYPRTDMSRQECYNCLISKVHNVSCAVVCQEHHQDGALHLHAFLGFSKKMDFSKPDCFDVAGRHPHISVVRSLPGLMQYLVKEDKDVFTFNMDVSKYLEIKEKQLSTTTQVGMMILEHKPIIEIITSFPSWATKIPNLIASANALKAIESKNLPTIREDFVAFWIKGAAGIGKSFGVRSVAGDQSIYFKTFGTRFWDGYDPEKHKCVILDDYHGDNQFEIADLKRAADKYQYFVDMKGSAQVAAQYRTFVITSNFDIESVLKHSKKTSNEYAAPIKRRFVYVDADNYVVNNNKYFSLEYFLNVNCLSFYKSSWDTEYAILKEKYQLSFDKCLEAYNKFLETGKTTREILGLDDMICMKDKKEYGIIGIDNGEENWD